MEKAGNPLSELTSNLLNHLPVGLDFTGRFFLINLAFLGIAKELFFFLRVDIFIFLELNDPILGKKNTGIP